MKCHKLKIVIVSILCVHFASNSFSQQKDFKEFTVDGVLFRQTYKDTNKIYQNHFSSYPKKYKKISEIHELRFGVTFLKDYFKTDREIPLKSLNDDHFLHTVLYRYYSAVYNYDSVNDPYILTLLKRHFTIFNKNLKNYGNCVVAIIPTEYSNANQNKCIFIFNEKKKELSVWTFDDFKIDGYGNIITVFRMKDYRTWTYYTYDTISNNFIPVAERYYKITN